MAFKPRSATEPLAETPEKLFPLLLRTGENSPGLWSQQTDILRDYVSHVDAHDLAVELPTGTGKTLTGLLIAEWRRRVRSGRVVFACPTVQLVRQVVQAAAKEGINVVDLSGPWRGWDAGQVARYESGKSIAIVPYSTVFNIKPHLGTPDLLIFDDAHAADQYVSSAYTVRVARRELPSVYEDLIEALRPGLSKERHAQLIMVNPGVGTKSNIDALFPTLRDEWLEPIDHALSKLGDLNSSTAKDASYRHAAIRGHLRACTVYVTWNAVEIRPIIAPTFENPVFSMAKQRLYLSATLGASGELERSFSRPKVTQLSLPPEAPKPRSGRRFVVFPHLVKEVDANALTKSILEMAERAIILTPSDWSASDAEKSIVPEGWSIFKKDHVVESFATFATTDRAACVLANRYDGLDLPGGDCRVVALYGLPRATNLHEEFLSGRARSGAAIEERMRSRVVQGTGRCTRGPRDWALVVIADPETTTYLSRREVQSALDEDLQAEIRFGLEQSDNSVNELIENVRIFLTADPAWQTIAEPLLADYRSEALIELPPTAAPLLASASKEVQAAEANWNEDWIAGGQLNHQAAELLNSCPEARGYRAYQLFLAATYINAGGRMNADRAALDSADALSEESVRVAAPATWMQASLPLPGAAEKTVSLADEIAITELTALVATAPSAAKHNARVAEMQSGLSVIDHNNYEPALSTLGKLLGAEAWKPKGDGRADSVWCWGNELWLTLEAKSEHKDDGQIGLDDVRQVNEHLKFLAEDRKVIIPGGSSSIMISPREAFKQDALVIAERFTFKVTLMEVLALASAVERCWLVLLTLRNLTNDVERRRAVEQTLTDARLLPSDVTDRLTLRPISGT